MVDGASVTGSTKTGWTVGLADGDSVRGSRQSNGSIVEVGLGTLLGEVEGLLDGDEIGVDEGNNDGRSLGIHDGARDGDEVGFIAGGADSLIFASRRVEN